MGFELVSWEQLLGDDKNFKRSGDVKRGRIKYKGESLFFLFYHLKFISYFVSVLPVSSDTTLKKRPLG